MIKARPITLRYDAWVTRASDKKCILTKHDPEESNDGVLTPRKHRGKLRLSEGEPKSECGIYYD